MPNAPRRADAVRNRARLLEAAEQVFAAQGTGVSTEEVARAAGVGVGTLFRHFPTKEALIDAVLGAQLQRLADAAADAALADDPGAAFHTLFRRIVAEAARKNALMSALAAADAPRQASSRAGRQLRRALRSLLARAQEAGAVRADLQLPDVLALLIATSRAVEHVSGDGARTRVIAVVEQGMRPASR